MDHALKTRPGNLGGRTTLVTCLIAIVSAPLLAWAAPAPAKSWASQVEQPARR
jgi:hypothetical protein